MADEEKTEFFLDHQGSPGSRAYSSGITVYSTISSSRPKVIGLSQLNATATPCDYTHHCFVSAVKDDPLNTNASYEATAAIEANCNWAPGDGPVSVPVQTPPTSRDGPFSKLEN